MKQDLLELRKRLKSKMPHFLAQDTHKIKRIRKRWRKPRGMDSKMRQGYKGYRRCVSIGYGSPVAVRGLHRSGLVQKLVLSVKDMEGLDIKKEGIIISSKVGLKKKLEIIKKAKEMGLRILNLKDADGYVKKVNEMLAAKKAEKTNIAKTKEDKKKKLEEKAKEKEEKEKKEKAGEGLADKIETAEQKDVTEKKEKEEKDRVLTKKL